MSPAAPKARFASAADRTLPMPWHASLTPPTHARRRRRGLSTRQRECLVAMGRYGAVSAATAEHDVTRPMRSLVRLGLAEVTPNGLYRLTELGQHFIFDTRKELLTMATTITLDGKDYEVVHSFTPGRLVIHYEGLYVLVDRAPYGEWELSGEAAHPHEEVVIKALTASMEGKSILTVTRGDGQ